MQITGLYVQNGKLENEKKFYQLATEYLLETKIAKLVGTKLIINSKKQPN